MEYRRGCIPQEYRRRGRPARLARFRRFRSGLGATRVTHDDDNLRAASTSTSATFASSERSMRWTNSWGRGLNRNAGVLGGRPRLLETIKPATIDLNNFLGPNCHPKSKFFHLPCE